MDCIDHINSLVRFSSDPSPARYGSDAAAGLTAALSDCQPLQTAWELLQRQQQQQQQQQQHETEQNKVLSVASLLQPNAVMQRQQQQQGMSRKLQNAIAAAAVLASAADNAATLALDAARFRNSSTIQQLQQSLEELEVLIKLAPTPDSAASVFDQQQQQQHNCSRWSLHPPEIQQCHAVGHQKSVASVPRRTSSLDPIARSTKLHRLYMQIAAAAAKSNSVIQHRAAAAVAVALQAAMSNAAATAAAAGPCNASEVPSFSDWLQQYIMISDQSFTDWIRSSDHDEILHRTHRSLVKDHSNSCDPDLEIGQHFVQLITISGKCRFVAEAAADTAGTLSGQLAPSQMQMQKTATAAAAAAAAAAPAAELASLPSSAKRAAASEAAAAAAATADPSRGDTAHKVKRLHAASADLGGCITTDAAAAAVGSSGEVLHQERLQHQGRGQVPDKLTVDGSNSSSKMRSDHREDHDCVDHDLDQDDEIMIQDVDHDDDHNVDQEAETSCSDSC